MHIFSIYLPAVVVCSPRWAEVMATGEHASGHLWLNFSGLCKWQRKNHQDERRPSNAHKRRKVLMESLLHAQTDWLTDWLTFSKDPMSAGLEKTLELQWQEPGAPGPAAASQRMLTTPGKRGTPILQSTRNQATQNTVAMTTDDLWLQQHIKVERYRLLCDSSDILKHA